MDKFVSKIAQVRCPAEIIFSHLDSMEMLSGLLQNEKVESVKASRDEGTFTIKGIAPIGIKIVDRVPFKTIKFASSDGKPIDFTLWLQLVEVSPNDTRARLTLHVQIPTLLRFILKKKIQSSLDAAADQIAATFSR